MHTGVSAMQSLHKSRAGSTTPRQAQSSGRGPLASLSAEQTLPSLLASGTRSASVQDDHELSF